MNGRKHTPSGPAISTPARSPARGGVVRRAVACPRPPTRQRRRPAPSPREADRAPTGTTRARRHGTGRRGPRRRAPPGDGRFGPEGQQVRGAAQHPGQLGRRRRGRRAGRNPPIPADRQVAKTSRRMPRRTVADIDAVPAGRQATKGGPLQRQARAVADAPAEHHRQRQDERRRAHRPTPSMMRSDHSIPAAAAARRATRHHRPRRRGRGTTRIRPDRLAQRQPRHR